MLRSKNSIIIIASVTMNGQPVECVSHTKFLGAIVNEILSWSNHFKKTYLKSSQIDISVSKYQKNIYR